MSRFVLRISVLLVLLILGWNAAGYLNNRPQSLPILSIPAETLDLGTRYETEALTCVLPVRNDSATLVRVTPHLGSCSCQLLDGKEFELPPGDTKDVKVSLDFRGGCKATARLFTEPFKAEFTAAIEGQRDVQRWTITGSMRRALNVSHKEIHFGRKEIGKEFPSRVVQVYLADDIESFELTAESGVEYQVKPIGPRGSFNLTLQPPVGTIATRRSCELHLTPVTKSLVQPPSTVIRLSWETLGTTRAEFDHILLGEVQLNCPIKRMIVICTQDSWLHLDKYSVFPEDSDVALLQRSTVGGVIELQYTPHSLGPIQRQLDVVFRTSGNTIVNVPITMYAVGIPPQGGN